MGIFPPLGMEKWRWRQEYIPKRGSRGGANIDPRPRPHPRLGIDLYPHPVGHRNFSPMRGGAQTGWGISAPLPSLVYTMQIVRVPKFVDNHLDCKLRRFLLCRISSKRCGYQSKVCGRVGLMSLCQLNSMSLMKLSRRIKTKPNALQARDLKHKCHKGGKLASTT